MTYRYVIGVQLAHKGERLIEGSLPFDSDVEPAELGVGDVLDAIGRLLAFMAAHENPLSG